MDKPIRRTVGICVGHSLKTRPMEFYSPCEVEPYITYLEQRAEEAEAQLAELAKQKPVLFRDSQGCFVSKGKGERLIQSGEYVTPYYLRPAPAAGLAELEDNSLIDHLEKCSAVVATWPEWKKQGADASKFTRPASEQAVWDGEGLPPAGVECEFAFIGNYRESFSRGKVIAYGPLEVIMQHWASGNEFIQPLDKITFRPIRTKAEGKRDEFTDSCIELDSSQDWSHSTDYFRGLYNAIAAGKIPGIKLEE